MTSCGVEVRSTLHLLLRLVGGSDNGGGGGGGAAAAAVPTYARMKVEPNLEDPFDDGSKWNGNDSWRAWNQAVLNEVLKMHDASKRNPANLAYGGESRKNLKVVVLAEDLKNSLKTGMSEADQVSNLKANDYAERIIRCEFKFFFWEREGGWGPIVVWLFI